MADRRNRPREEGGRHEKRCDEREQYGRERQFRQPQRGAVEAREGGIDVAKGLRRAEDREPTLASQRFDGRSDGQKRVHNSSPQQRKSGQGKEPPPHTRFPADEENRRDSHLGPAEQGGRKAGTGGAVVLATGPPGRQVQGPGDRGDGERRVEAERKELSSGAKEEGDRDDPGGGEAGAGRGKQTLRQAS